MFDRVYNFSAGPSVMPEEALLRAQKEMLNYGNSGMSVMEMSHRSPVFAYRIPMRSCSSRAVRRCSLPPSP